MRVHITDVHAGDKLAKDVFNEFGLHVLSQGTVLSDNELSRLYQHRIDYLEIEWRTTVQTSPAPNSAADSVSAKFRPAYTEALTGFERLFEKALAKGVIRMEDVQETFLPLVDKMKTERDVVSLLLLLNSGDEYTYVHSVQVGMLSYYIAGWLGWTGEETLRAGTAGFLHDIGKCYISDAILKKPSRLTEDEIAEIKKHPQLGYDIVKRSFPDDDALSLAALQHHERMDGTGYPHGITAESIHPFARIVAVADVYSAMTTQRIYRDKQDLLVVLKELQALSFHALDPHITHTFIRHMLPNFIGKKVELSDGSHGTIVMNNPTNYFRPLVQTEGGFIDLASTPRLEIKHVHM